MKQQRENLMLGYVEKGNNLMLMRLTQWQHWLILNSSQQSLALVRKH